MWPRTLAIVAAASIFAAAAHAQMTPAQYHKQVGPCACPNDKDKAGRKCGKRSAYCRAGGAEVKGCYLVDVERRKKEACG